MALAMCNTEDITEGMTLEEQYRAAFDPNVREDMKESWEKSWKSWFVTTETAEDERFPGKLKVEFSFKRGHFVALAPKSYFAWNAEDTSQKLGSKAKLENIKNKILNLKKYIKI